MMPVQLIVIPVWVERLGWTLVHSLWQLTVFAILSAIVLRFIRNRSARGRYAAAVAMLALMVSGPVVTWLLVSVEPVWSMSSLLAAEQFGVRQDVPSVVQKPVTTEAGSVGFEESRPVAVVAIPLAADSEEMNALIPISEVDVESASETSASPTQPGSKPAASASVLRESIEKCARAIKPRLPILVGVWFLGVVICSIRPVWGLWIQWRLRHAGLQPVSESIQSTLNVLIQKLGLRRVVRVAESALVKVPLVVGYLHPMILLPASVITGLTSSQLEAVLAHELAHVRRHDWLVNALQVIVETLLFYHPAVWWLSSRIRQERELCCDDIALSLDVDKAVFARTLLTLEELRQQAMTPALAATGGDLAARVRRLLPAPSPDQARSPAAGFAVIIASLTLVLVASSMTTVVRSESQSVDTLFVATSDNRDSAGAFAKANAKTGEAVVTGQVIHTNGKPAVGVEINFGTNRHSLSEGALLTGVTDASGRYRFRIPERHLASRARVYVIPVDAAAVSRAVSKNFGEQPIFQLQPGTRLSGRVMDADGKGVANVVVKIDGGERIPMRYSMTNHQGAYITPPCQYGNYEIQLVDSGAIQSSDERGVTLPSAYLRKEHVISKSARSQEQLEDFYPVDSVKIQVHLQSSEGTPVSDDGLYLQGTAGLDSWSERLHEITERPGLYEIMAPKGLFGGFGRMHPHGWPKNDYVLSVANSNLGHFVRDESLVFTMKKTCWLELTIAVDGNLINQKTQVHNISDGNSGNPFHHTPDSGVLYSLKAAGDPLGKRFANPLDIGPISRGRASLHMTLAPDTEYELRLETLSGKSWTDTFTTKEGESRKIEANLVSSTQTANSITEADEPPELSEAETEEKNTVVPKDENSPANNDVRKRTVKVHDENEQPVAGAEVRLQFQHDSEKSFNIDGLLSETTNEKGVVQVEAPGESDVVHVTVKAEGFGEFSERQQATGASIIRLKRGRVIHVRAVDETGNILRKAVPLLAMHRVWGREFVPQDDGTFKSPAVEMTRQMMRVAAAQENGPMLFSDLIDVAIAEPGEDGILNIALKPGVRFLGRLDDSVPRPISEGYVSLMIVDGPNHGLGTGAWTWEDSAPVAPDGTFVFESLPGGGHVQFHVTVDGYMSSRPSDEAITKYVTDHQLVSNDVPDQLKKGLEYGSNARPQLAWLNQSEIKVDVPCEKTASCDFRILDPAGKPISNANVSFSPNGHFLFGRHFIPGSPKFPAASLVDQLMRENAALFPGLEDKSPRGIAQQKMREWAMRSFVAAKSDANGRVRIRNLFGGTRESFSVQADGFVLPQSPIYGSENESDFGGRRYGLVDLIAGETIERTIYLDREQVIINREVLVVDEKAKPLEGITVALAEMRVGKNDWQLWSVQRFGTLPQEKTDENGRVLLRIPESIDDAQVQRIRLAVNHRTNRSGELWLAGGLVEASPTADDGVIMVLRNPDSSRSSRAAYGKLDELLPKRSSAELLKAMIENPSLAMLRQLLAETKSPRPEPVELLDEGRFSGENKPAGFRVHVLPSGEGKVAVVLAKVRPADGSRQQETDFDRLPECAFVFDMDGNLIAPVGGRIGTTGAGSAENVDILCLGPAEDWFVRVTRFQENGQFVYQSEYYRMVNPVVPSLRYFHYANSNGWSNGPETVPRYGRLHFGFPDDRGSSQIDRIGTTPDGRTFVDSIFWDGDKNQFVGAAELTVEKRPLFRVDTEWSKDFSPLTTTSSQITLLGGEREYDHWYAWETCVPAGYEAIVRVSVPQKDGKPKVIEQTYTSGRQNIQFHAAPTEDNATIKLQLGYGEKATIQTSEVPFTLGDPPTQRPSIVNTLSSGESMTLVQRTLMGSEQPLTLSVRLQATKELGQPR